MWFSTPPNPRAQSKKHIFGPFPAVFLVPKQPNGKGFWHVWAVRTALGESALGIRSTSPDVYGRFLLVVDRGTQTGQTEWAKGHHTRAENGRTTTKRQATHCPSGSCPWSGDPAARSRRSESRRAPFLGYLGPFWARFGPGLARANPVPFGPWWGALRAGNARSGASRDRRDE